MFARLSGEHGADFTSSRKQSRDNDIGKGLRPQVAAYHLPTEPWVFVIDRDGTVSTVIEGPFSVAELKSAVDKVASG
jgi:hypothetical protein